MEKFNLEADGYFWFRNALNEKDLLGFDQNLKLATKPGARLSCKNAKLFAPNAFKKLNKLAQSLLKNAKPVRFLVFDKNKENNWGLPWHQDRVIAVQNRCELTGYTSWTRKNGIWHVEPPIEILEKMMFARVHLDNTDSNNGCLQISQSSHQLGKIPAKTASEVAQKYEIHDCEAKRGDVLFVKALCLHGSQASKSTCPRRTIRIDYSAEQLSHPLEWAD